MSLLNCDRCQISQSMCELCGYCWDCDNGYCDHDSRPKCKDIDCTSHQAEGEDGDGSK